MENKLCTKSYGVLIGIHEVMKLQNFEFGVNDVIHANEKNIPLLFFFFFFFLHIFANFMETEHCVQFYDVFDYFY